MTDSEQMTAAKKQLADERAARDKANEKHAKSATEIKPTPTQEENDLAAMGVHIVEHEPDGSSDPNEPQDKQATKREHGADQSKQAEQAAKHDKQAEPAKHEQRGSYQTRTTTPAT